MNSKYLKYLPIFLILLLGGTSITWTNSHSLLNTGDFLFPINRLHELDSMVNSWNKTSLGYTNYFNLSYLLPFGLYFFIIQLANISVIGSQIFWNYLLFTSLGLSMYFLVITLVHGNTRYVAGLIAAIFFMLNQWTALNIAMFYPYITFIPLILGLYVKGLNERKGLNYIILFSLVWFLVLPLFLLNIRGYIIQWILLSMYFLFFSVHNPRKIGRAFMFTFILGIIHILLNSHWLFLSLINIFNLTSGSIKTYNAVGYSRLGSFESASSTLVQSVRMISSSSFSASMKGILHYPWLSFYQGPLLILIGFLLPISALISLLFVIKKRASENRHFIFFFILLLLGYFISMGKFNPAGTWLAGKFQFYLLVFSAPAVHGGIFIVISYSVILAYSFVFISNITRNMRFKLAIGFLYVVAILISGFPVLSGSFIPQGNKILGAGQYQIPPYVFDLKKLVDSENLNYRIFPIPYSNLAYFAYSWLPAGYNGPDPLVNILDQPQVMRTGIGMQIADTTTNNVDKTSFFRLNSLLNVKYVMNKRDANLLHIKNNSWYTVPDQTFLNSLYQDKNNISTFGQIDLIKIPDDLFLPKLYTPLRIINANNVNELPNIVSQKDYQTRSAIYVDNHPNTPNTPNIPNASKKAILEYRMISPVKYRVRVHSAEGSFPLVMSESFHEGWKAYLTDSSNLKLEIRNLKLPEIQGTIQNDNLPAGPIWETWFKKPIIDDAGHLMVNGYANSWIVDTNKLCHPELAEGSIKTNCLKKADGSYDFELVIEFWPQRIYYLGLAISLTTLLSCIGYLIAQHVISKKRSDLKHD